MAEGSSKSGWIVLGMLLGCAGLIGVIFLGCAGIIGTGFVAMQSAEPVASAIEEAKVSPMVVARLGEPVEAGFFSNVSMNIDGPRGHASAQVPLSGPYGSATMVLEAEMYAETWEYEKFFIRFEDGSTENLLEGY